MIFAVFTQMFVYFGLLASKATILKNPLSLNFMKCREKERCITFKRFTRHSSSDPLPTFFPPMDLSILRLVSGLIHMRKFDINHGCAN